MWQPVMSPVVLQIVNNFGVVVPKISYFSVSSLTFYLNLCRKTASFLVNWEIRAMLNGIGNRFFYNPELY